MATLPLFRFLHLTCLTISPDSLSPVFHKTFKKSTRHYTIHAFHNREIFCLHSCLLDFQGKFRRRFLVVVYNDLTAHLDRKRIAQNIKPTTHRDSHKPLLGPFSCLQDVINSIQRIGHCNWMQQTYGIHEKLQRDIFVEYIVPRNRQHSCCLRVLRVWDGYRPVHT